MCLQTIFALFLAIFARNNRSQSENLYTIVLLYIKNYRQHPRKRFFSKFILIPIKALAKCEAEITLTGQVLLQRTLIVFVVE